MRRRAREALRRVGAVLEGSRNVYWRLTALENLVFFGNLCNRPARVVRQEAAQLLEMFGLADRAHRVVGELSRGMQQKVAICAALIRRPQVLLLDEPTVGLDVETAREMRHLLARLAREEGRTIVVSSHEMPFIQSVCERVIIIHAGRVVVHDAVDRLLELFRARAYALRLAGHLAQEAVERLRASFPMLTVHYRGDDTELEVQLPDSGPFYVLVDLLRQEGAVVEAIDRRDPDLEEIFIRIVQQKTPFREVSGT